MAAKEAVESYKLIGEFMYCIDFHFFPPHIDIGANLTGKTIFKLEKEYVGRILTTKRKFIDFAMPV